MLTKIIILFVGVMLGIFSFPFFLVALLSRFLAEGVRSKTYAFAPPPVLGGVSVGWLLS